MSMTVRELALRLAELVQQGHADSVVAIDAHQPDFIGQRTGSLLKSVAVGRDWNHGTVLLWPEEVLTRLTPPASNDHGPVDVERDEEGFWTHPAHPEGVAGADLNEWFAARDLTYTMNYLLAPEHAVAPNDFPGGAPDFSEWELRQPAGNGWYLWDIRLNDADEPIAVWVHSNK